MAKISERNLDALDTIASYAESNLDELDAFSSDDDKGEQEFIRRCRRGIRFLREYTENIRNERTRKAHLKLALKKDSLPPRSTASRTSRTR